KIKVDRAAGEKEIKKLMAGIETIAEALLPILPETARLIKSYVLEGKMPEKPLFLRKE
ncbi:hypothetical protein IT397_03260, partial [Candidatus Nomurabacteria bacterium]|nr:hypothetical protein [Candidatus Nomurabacteria bacterium]